MRIKKVSQTAPTQAQVVDGYSTSTTDSYSCNYVNNSIQALIPSVLYNDASGTNENVTLSETAANFTYLEIFYRTNDGYYSSTKVYSPNNKIAMLMSGYINTDSTSGNIKLKLVKINGTTITKEKTIETTGASWSSTNYIYITRVEGHK